MASCKTSPRTCLASRSLGRPPRQLKSSLAEIEPRNRRGCEAKRLGVIRICNSTAQGLGLCLNARRRKLAQTRTTEGKQLTAGEARLRVIQLARPANIPVHNLASLCADRFDGAVLGFGHRVRSSPAGVRIGVS